MDKYITSNLEKYAFAIEEQEISTKEEKYKEENENQAKLHLVFNKCSLCHIPIEDNIYIYISVHISKMFARYYLPLRHDVIHMAICNETLVENPGGKNMHCKKLEFIKYVGDKKINHN